MNRPIVTFVVRLSNLSRPLVPSVVGILSNVDRHFACAFIVAVMYNLCPGETKIKVSQSSLVIAHMVLNIDCNSRKKRLSMFFR